jgi:uncharacterized cupredoxin-like copper-binding protein
LVLVYRTLRFHGGFFFCIILQRQIFSNFTMKKSSLILIGALLSIHGFAQDANFAQGDTIAQNSTTIDSLRIVDLNPFFTLHVDSMFNYQLQINKNPQDYFWYLKNAPVGLRINKEDGMVSFEADKSYFLSGKLKYDVNYKVLVGVQNLNNPAEKIDTSFTIVFYNTEIIPSKVKPTVDNNLVVEEGETVDFNVVCEEGSFPVQDILTLTSFPIGKYQAVQKCGDEFSWTIPFDVVKDSDPNKQKSLTLYFIGSTKFKVRDTAVVKLTIKDALNYPVAVEDYNQTVRNINKYVLQLKYTFLELDKRLKKTKHYRTTFDLTSASTSLTGTILSTNDGTLKYGKILPSVGLALVPIKEAAVPSKGVDQNQAALIRTSIKRLEYMVQDNQLIGEKDYDIARKNSKLRDELKQVQVQLIDVPLDMTNNLTEEELNRYFNSPKVNKKYRLKSK